MTLLDERSEFFETNEVSCVVISNVIYLFSCCVGFELMRFKVGVDSKIKSARVRRSHVSKEVTKLFTYVLEVGSDSEVRGLAGAMW